MSLPAPCATGQEFASRGLVQKRTATYRQVVVAPGCRGYGRWESSAEANQIECKEGGGRDRRDRCDQGKRFAGRGTATITRVATSNGQLVAVGTLSGTAKRASGAVVGSVANRAVQFPLQQATGTCTILHL